MKRVLFLLATVSAFAVSSAATAQAVREPEVVARGVVRPAINADALAQRMRDRGVGEDTIRLNVERIRAAIASGKYPHLARRIYNATHPDTGDDANRRRWLNATPTDTDRATDRTVDRPADRTTDRPVRTDITPDERTAVDVSRRSFTLTPSAGRAETRITR